MAAEEFQGGVCGGENWWSSSVNLFRPSPPYSSLINGVGSFDFDWLTAGTEKSTTDDDSAVGGAAAAVQNPNQISDVGTNSVISKMGIWSNLDLLDEIVVGMDCPEMDRIYKDSSDNTVQQIQQISDTFLPLIDSDAQFSQSSSDAQKIDTSFIMPTFLSDTINLNLHNLINKHQTEEPELKRTRLVTPSSLPTFKVRKDKLGDRITALQQLVSPFGKTDTASVLNEAIDYIKFLHDQLSILSAPHLKDGLQHQQGGGMNEIGMQKDTGLKRRGLCVVPISTTLQIANDTPTDFWTPTFMGSFK